MNGVRVCLVSGPEIAVSVGYTTVCICVADALVYVIDRLGVILARLRSISVRLLKRKRFNGTEVWSTRCVL